MLRKFAVSFLSLKKTQLNVLQKASAESFLYSEILFFCTGLRHDILRQNKYGLAFYAYFCYNKSAEKCYKAKIGQAANKPGNAKEKM